MGKVNLSALRVRQSAIAQLANGKTTKTPCWLDITADVPPAGVLTRNPVIPHQLERQRVRVRNDPKTGTGVWQTVVTAAKKPQKKRSVRDATRPQELVYEEDELRRRFYRDHPWELARPRVILENRGNDYRRYDWSKLLQPNKRLDGE
ncbi:mitochondrial ribosomal small subunit component, partial [Ascosphaera acerosa]